MPRSTQWKNPSRDRMPMASAIGGACHEEAETHQEEWDGDDAYQDQEDEGYDDEAYEGYDVGTYEEEGYDNETWEEEEEEGYDDEAYDE